MSIGSADLLASRWIGTPQAPNRDELGGVEAAGLVVIAPRQGETTAAALKAVREDGIDVVVA